MGSQRIRQDLSDWHTTTAPSKAPTIFRMTSKPLQVPLSSGPFNLFSVLSPLHLLPVLCTLCFSWTGLLILSFLPMNYASSQALGGSPVHSFPSAEQSLSDISFKWDSPAYPKNRPWDPTKNTKCIMRPPYSGINTISPKLMFIQNLSMWPYFQTVSLQM